MIRTTAQNIVSAKNWDEVHQTSSPRCDGILLNGKRLYVVRNRMNQIAVIRLSPNLSSGRVVRTITHPDFDVPTTIDELGNRLYAVNARFTTPPGPDVEYWLTRVHK